MSKLLRDPWPLTLLILMLVVWINGVFFGYVWGWKFGDPFAVAYRWIARKLRRTR